MTTIENLNRATHTVPQTDMRLRIRRVLPIIGLLLVVGHGPTAFPQERRGPKTLENLLDAPAEVTPHGTVSRPPGGSTDPAIEEAWNRYDKAVRTASTKLVQRFGPADTKAAAGKPKPASSGDASAGAEAARRGFVEQGRLPSVFDAGLRSAAREAETAYRDAASTLRRHYEEAAGVLQKAGKAEQAEAITQEWTLLQHVLDLATEPQLDSTWKHSIENGPSAEITLYSNGTINAPDGPDTWTLQGTTKGTTKGTTLVIRWKNPEAPGGEWIDTVEVAPHGGSYAGRNQLGTRITGTRVP